MSESNPTVKPPVVKVRAAGRVQRPVKPSPHDLRKYPLLVYAPLQWGAGVRTEDKGVPTVECYAVVEAKNGDFQAAATQLGTTPAHVQEAYQYEVEQRLKYPSE